MEGVIIAWAIIFFAFVYDLNHTSKDSIGATRVATVLGVFSMAVVCYGTLTLLFGQ